MGSTQDEVAIDHYLLSQRAAHNFVHGDVWGPREQSMGNPWSPTNPTGSVNLRLAENSLMHEEIGQRIKSQVNVLPMEHLTYSTGPRGSRRLRRAAACFLNETFHARQPITADNIFVTPGLASAIDAMAWSICNDGDGILIPRPFYNGFQVDILNRSNAQVVPVSYGIEGYSSMDDLFRPDVNRKALQAALNTAHDSGIIVRALLVSNPHNPLGRCYPPETIKEFVSFCAANSLHYISDEIYAHSVFRNPALPNAMPFVSGLSLDLDDLINPGQVHVLYGASKDFCANGLRLGFLCTRNRGIIGAMSSISMFSWSPHVLQDIWAGMLEDKPWMEDFLARKRELTEKNHAIAASFFHGCGIPYYEMKAGLFFWINLRRFISTTTTRPSENKNPMSITSDTDGYKARELRICEICMEHGVLIAPGQVYGPEELGWFRVTFTVGTEALQEGLKRLKDTLVQVEKGGQALVMTGPRFTSGSKCI
ncbi:pyridoxal phosphate-dependent transferase [Aspergillus pseudodeflectus]|uniref:Pyridoxal phosphate-dependent transferase n=1 Tax=Aspergillus pseudodeflectus TaxID=176178 RepID=A0ABR4JXY2_9EURO